MRHLIVLFAMLGFSATSAWAARLDVSVDIPQLRVSEYHRPYVAIWIEREDNRVAANLAVWYQQTDTKEGAGSKWLADLRQWWRRSGRDQSLPIDGVSGASRPVGQHKLSFAADQAPLAGLTPGKYRLVVEAVREVGGREVLNLPFQWPVESAQQARVSGEHELGVVSLELVP